MAFTAAEQKIYAGTHSDYFLKIDGIEGESTDDKHKNELNILSWSFGSRQPGASAVGGKGAGAGKVQFSDIEFIKYVDKSSPKLMLACANGQHFDSVLLTCRKAGGTPVEFLKIKLTDVLVSSQETVSNFDGSSSSTQFKELLPMDKFSLNFTQIDVTYTSQDSKGNPAGQVEAGWNLQTNKKS
jgi:type VI secretion system secreted protein Hcp